MGRFLGSLEGPEDSVGHERAVSPSVQLCDGSPRPLVGTGMPFGCIGLGFCRTHGWKNGCGS